MKIVLSGPITSQKFNPGNITSWTNSNYKKLEKNKQFLWKVTTYERAKLLSGLPTPQPLLSLWAPHIYSSPRVSLVLVIAQQSFNIFDSFWFTGSNDENELNLQGSWPCGRLWRWLVGEPPPRCTACRALETLRPGVRHSSCRRLPAVTTENIGNIGKSHGI